MTDKQFKYLKKFIGAVMFVHLSGVMMTVSFFGLYYKGQINDCKKVAERLELGDWAKEQVDKYEADHKIKSMQDNYETQGIKAEEH